MPIEGATKITVEIDDALAISMKEVIPWGLRRHLVTAVIKLIVDAVRSDGQVVLGLILDGDYKLVRDEDDKPKRSTEDGGRTSKRRASSEASPRK